MKGLEKRLIIIPRGVFGNSKFTDFVKYVKDITNLMHYIDHDTKIKNACEQVLLKESKIKSLKGICNEEFHEEIINGVTSSGTNFLIFKN